MYDFVAAVHHRKLPVEHVLRTLTPLYLGRTAAWVVQASALEDLPPVLERLTEDHRVESSGDRELLCLVLGAR